MTRRFTKYPSSYVKAETDIDFENKIKEFVAIIKQQPEIKRLYPNTWTSGSSTTVYPITVSQDDISLQRGSGREPKNFRERMEQLGKEMGIIKYSYWARNDGSCPPEVVFKLAKFRY